MFKYFVTFINPLLLLIGFWLFFNTAKGIYWLLVLAVLIILLSGRILARNYFWRFKLLWFNFILVYISQLLFLLILISGQSRYTLALILSLLWVVVWWFVARYFSDIRNIEGQNEFVANKFLYYLSFWFLSTSLYSLLIFIHLKTIYALLLILIAAFTWSIDILRSKESVVWPYALFVLLLLAQLMIVLYLLPINFYVAGTIATLWFFFIIDNTSNQLKHFKLYLSLFLGITLLLLITSTI